MIFVCFIHVFSLELVHGRGLRLIGLKKGAFQVEGSKLACFTSRACLLSREPTFLSRVVNYSRVVNFPICHNSWTTHESSTFQNFKSHNFSDLSSFLVLGIISSTEVQIKWFKLLWKFNSKYYNFYEETFLRKLLFNGQNNLEPNVYAWMVTLGEGVMPFQVLDYN